MNIHGIIFDDECNGEPVNFGGLEIERCETVVAPGFEDGTGLKLSTIRGQVLEVRKILRAADCRSDADRALLDLNRGRPFIRATARIFDDGYAKCYADLMAQRRLLWAAEGYILERAAGGIAQATLTSVRLRTDFVPSRFRVFPGLG